MPHEEKAIAMLCFANVVMVEESREGICNLSYRFRHGSLGETPTRSSIRGPSCDTAIEARRISTIFYNTSSDLNYG